MRKILIILLLFIKTNLFSQIFIGATGGINVSKIKYDNQYYNSIFSPFQKFRPGINSGLMSYLYFGKVMDVRLETSYSQKGFNYEDTYTKGHKNFSYAEISTAGQLDLNYDKKVNFSPYLGYFVAYWLSGKYQYFDYKNSEFITGNIYLKSDTTFAYNRIDLGLLAGIDTKIKLSRKQILTIGFRYEHGLLSTEKNKIDGWKNRNLSLYLALNFKINKK